MKDTITLTVNSNFGKSQINMPYCRVGKKYEVTLSNSQYHLYVTGKELMLNAIHSVIGSKIYKESGFSETSIFECLGDNIFAVREGENLVFIRMNSFSLIEVFLRNELDDFFNNSNYVHFLNVQHDSAYQPTTLIIYKNQISGSCSCEVINWNQVSIYRPFTPIESK